RGGAGQRRSLEERAAIGIGRRAAFRHGFPPKVLLTASSSSLNFETDTRLAAPYGQACEPRSWGGVSRRPSGKKSSGRLARISKARANPFPFSRNTISSPRRKISTSLPLSRNPFGNW